MTGPDRLREVRPAPDGPSRGRRSAIFGAMAMFFAPSKAQAQAGIAQPERRWYEAALRMKRLAESWGDQAYGAVLVLDGAIIGDGPSRVIKNNDITAHAEREAIRDARRRLGRQRLDGAVLYSTSRPCSVCEAAAAQAGVSRMYFGPSLVDAGTPSATAP
jgi:tRNA(Arg) A34 adenosine deaminase TadA